MEIILIFFINIIFWVFIWRDIEKINLKGNLFGLDVYI
jgi:hypothetical protein